MFANLGDANPAQHRSSRLHLLLLLVRALGVPGEHVQRWTDAANGSLAVVVRSLARSWRRVGAVGYTILVLVSLTVTGAALLM